ncbi:MAG: DUF4424 family protein [Elusimicrobiaceae bacterium]|nr:DUF4424 family protein [Elusimicrobiaceae bacterium]
MKKTILFIFAMLIVFVGTARTNDTSSILLPTGEIRFDKQPSILLKHEALLLSDTVTVDYLFENTADTPVETTVFFPVPTVGPIIDGYVHDLHDFKFRVWSNGTEIIPSLSHQIIFHGTDVTKYFDLMGIDSYLKPLTLQPFGEGNNGLELEKVSAPLRKLPKAEQKRLKQLGMIAKGCWQKDEATNKCMHNPDVYHLVWGDYQQEAIYYWTQTFPPHQTIHIRHEYKPSFVENSIGAPRKFVQEIIGWDYEKPHEYWNEASYIITTANNWQTPIKQFNLLIWGQTGAAVSAYKDEQTSYTRVAPKNYLLETKQDFVPSQEILFELAHTCDYAKREPSILPQLYRVDGPARVRSIPNGRKITTLENGRYVWAYPSDTKDWFVVLLDEKTTGYTYRTNLIPFGN